jgi:hypothetical protein
MTVGWRASILAISSVAQTIVPGLETTGIAHRTFLDVSIHPIDAGGGRPLSWVTG